VRQRCGRSEGLLGGGRIEEITLQVKDPRPGDEPPVDVARTKADGRAEEGTHGALRIRCYQDEAAAGGRPVGRARRVIEHSRRAQIMAEDLAKLVIAYLADVLRTASEGGHANDRVGGRAAGDLHTGAHGLVELLRACLVHEAHRPLDQPEAGDQFVVGLAQDVHERIADTEHVEIGRLSHGGHPGIPAGSGGRAAGPASCGRAAGKLSGR